MNNHFLTLCLVTHFSAHSFPQYKSTLLHAIAGGVTSIQLRVKHIEMALLRKIALEIKLLLEPFAIPLIINDHVYVAKEVDADGVHLGQEDVSPLLARDILGPDKIIGLSIETFPELEQANKLDCINYVGASAVFASKTKLNCKTVWGVDGLKNLVAHSKHPVVGIGGIDNHNIAAVIKAGASGVAVISAIQDANNIQLATSELLTTIKTARGVHHVV